MTSEGDEGVLKVNGESLNGDGKAFVCNEEESKADADG